MSEFSHSFRSGKFGDERAFTLNDYGLSVAKKDEKFFIPFKDIQSIRLVTYSTMKHGRHGGRATVGPKIAEATIKADGHKTFKVRSHHFVSMGQLENRCASYRNLITELLLRVAKANPECSFVSGSTLMRAALIGAFILSSLSMIMGLYFLLTGSENRLSAAGVAFTALMISLCLWWGIIENKQKIFDPADPPKIMLRV